MKRCKTCGMDKPLEDFYLEKGKPRANCKACHKAKLYAKRNEDREAYRVKQNAWAAKNREKLNEKSRQFRAENADRINAERRAKRVENPEKFRAVQKTWRDANLERARAVRRKSHEKHKDRVNAALRADRKANPEKYRRWGKEYRERYPEELRERRRVFYQDNKELYEYHRRKREARLVELEYDGWTRREIFERDGGVCRGCNIPLTLDNFTVDHIVPVSLPGSANTRNNVQLMCWPCNREKWDRLEGQIYLPV